MKKLLETTIIIACVVGLIVLIVLIVEGYIFNWDWTGLSPYISPPHPKDSDFQRGKTLWDWLQLLIIPIVLALGGYVINLTISSGEQEATKQRAKTEREIAEDNQREASLQAYIDKMSELLLHEKLRESQPTEEVREIAHVRTLTVLPRLDGKRKGSVLQFLHESGLIDRGNKIIGRGNNIVDLDGADLSRAPLSEANLYEANLSRAKLSEANLYEANLSKANLDGADLGSAFLINANLSNANLRGAHLSGANLTKADLSYAMLNDATFKDADLRLYDRGGADLTYANLDGATVTQEQLNQAKSLQGATLPDGSLHP